VKEDLVIYKELFYGEFLELQSYSKHRNHFDVNFKQTCSGKKNQVIPIGMFESFCFVFVKM
jgi:hypothetical protein